VTAKFAIGFDFGTESVRAVIVSVHDGSFAAQAIRSYTHGVIDEVLPGSGVRIGADYALQHPLDWIDNAADACRAAIAEAGITPDQVIGIGVDFTSCTMLPTLCDGTPLCMLERFASVPLAWPKLWKHHGAKVETDRINDIARQRNEPWLARYGGSIGLEWFFPKVLETLNHAPNVYAAADVWLEAGDWFVWQLTAGPFPHCQVDQLARSTCQAGYKAMWNAQDGFPSRDFFAAVHPQLGDVVQQKMPGRLLGPGHAAGTFTAGSAERFGLNPGIPVSAAIIDAHAGLPGAGVADEATMVLVMGTSSCHMLNSSREMLAPGIAGVVRDGIIPGYFGYETGQASVGDAFNWIVRTVRLSHDVLTADAQRLPPGSGGVLAIDWLNGCRTPLMDGRLSGAFLGLTLGTSPAQLYRALLEASAFGTRWIVDTLRDAGVRVERFVASGGLPHKSPLLMQIYVDVLGAPITIATAAQPVALGAAILGAVAAGAPAGGHATVAEAVRAMAVLGSEAITYSPVPTATTAYDTLYTHYRRLTTPDGPLAQVMRSLRTPTG
jgi:L-ribulokinase